jgi:hypothetical protein
MKTFDLNTYGSVFGPLLAAAPLNELGPGTPFRAKEAELRKISADAAFVPNPIIDRPMAELCLAGLWLMYDFLDESHTISQSIENASGSYWHAILHRREPDYSNAKYWFRQVGRHPIFSSLAAVAQGLAAVEPDKAVAHFADSSPWEPNRFVDLCAAVAAGRAGCERFCRAVQQRECRLLFDYCYHAATEA